MELDSAYLRTCYQFRIFFMEEEVISTGDDYIYDKAEMRRKRKLLIDALPNDWDVIVIEWKGKQP